MQKTLFEAQWLILQQNKPDDYVVSTGKQYSVKQFINLAARNLNIKIKWKGKDINEKGYDKNGNVIIECSKKYFRPAEVDTLLGNSAKARKKLKWKPKISINQLVKEMVESDFSKLKILKLTNDN